MAVDDDGVHTMAEADADAQFDTLVTLMTGDSEIALEQDQLATMREAQDNRPRNTTKNFQSKQKEFVEWMRQQNFIDQTTLLGAKVHSFLRSVLNRPSKRKSSSVVGFSTLKSYGAACIDLYKQQQYLHSNSNPHPRDNPAVKRLFETARASIHTHKRQTFEDRGAGTIKDGYSTSAELTRISDYFMRLGSFSGLRYRMMFLLSHACLMRGESVRKCELADLFCLNFESGGLTYSM